MRLHVGQQRLAAPDRPLDADPQHLIGDCLGDRGERLVTQQHGVVDDGIEPVVLAANRAAAARKRRPIRHVRRIRLGTAARGANLRGGRGHGRSLDVHESYGRAVLRQPYGDRAPEPAPGTGDQDALLGQLSDRSHANVPVI